MDEEDEVLHLRQMNEKMAYIQASCWQAVPLAVWSIIFWVFYLSAVNQLMDVASSEQGCFVDTLTDERIIGPASDATWS